MHCTSVASHTCTTVTLCRRKSNQHYGKTINTMERKEFLASTCKACMLMAAGYFLPKLTGCSPAYSVFKTDIVNKKVTVPLNIFDQHPLQFVRPKGWYFDIAVQKNEDNIY